MSLKIDVRRLFILGMMVQLIGGYLARILANQHAHCTKCQNESTPWLVWVDDKPENIEQEVELAREWGVEVFQFYSTAPAKA